MALKSSGRRSKGRRLVPLMMGSRSEAEPYHTSRMEQRCRQQLQGSVDLKGYRGTLHPPLVVRHRDLLAHQDLLARGVILERHTHQMNLYGAVIDSALCSCRSRVDDMVIAGIDPPGKRGVEPLQVMWMNHLSHSSHLYPNSCKSL